jgi:hypothetical protein
MKAFAISLQLVLASSIALTAITDICGLRPAQAQAFAAAESMNGLWVNVDPNTRGLVRIEIHDRRIHPYGACHPDLCDWGVLKARSFAAGVDSSPATAMLARQATSFSRSEISLSLEAHGRLRVEVFTHFTDQSGRADYRSVDYFAHNRAPYNP